MTHWLRRFPFQVALGALLFYALTLSHGVTVGNLALTAKVAGWDWRPLAVETSRASMQVPSTCVKMPCH